MNEDDKEQESLIPADLDDKTVKKYLNELGFNSLNVDSLDLPDLTEKQRQIFKLRLRGFSQAAIGEVVGITQQAVAKHWRLIKNKFEAMGKDVNQPAIVGESVSLYTEVNERAWELFYIAKNNNKLGDANRALHTVMQAREKQLQLLMDLGILKRAAIEHDHSVDVSPLVKQWTEGEAQRRMVVDNVIETQLDDLEEPEPPSLPSNIENTELEEPTPEGSEDDEPEPDG